VTPAELDHDISILQAMRRRDVMHVVCNNKPMRIPALVDVVSKSYRDKKLATRLLKRTVLQMVDDGALSVGDDYLVRLGSPPTTAHERVLRDVQDVWGHDSLHEQILRTTARMHADEFKPRNVLACLRGQKSRHATATMADVLGALIWLSATDRAYKMSFILRDGSEPERQLDMNEGMRMLADDDECAGNLYPMFRKNRSEP